LTKGQNVCAVISLEAACSARHYWQTIQTLLKLQTK